MHWPVCASAKFSTARPAAGHMAFHYFPGPLPQCRHFTLCEMASRAAVDRSATGTTEFNGARAGASARRLPNGSIVAAGTTLSSASAAAEQKPGLFGDTALLEHFGSPTPQPPPDLSNVGGQHGELWQQPAPHHGFQQLQPHPQPAFDFQLQPHFPPQMHEGYSQQQGQRPPLNFSHDSVFPRTSAVLQPPLQFRLDAGGVVFGGGSDGSSSSSLNFNLQGAAAPSAPFSSGGLRFETGSAAAPSEHRRSADSSASAALA